MFEELIEAIKYKSLGQISHALYEVGGVSEGYVIRFKLTCLYKGVNYVGSHE